MDKCASCHDNPAQIYCKCKNPPVPVCVRCLQSHKSSHSLNAGDSIPQPIPSSRPLQVRSCLLCHREPVYVCADCCTYVCPLHSEAHKSTCPQAEMYPVEMAIHLSKPKGKEMLLRNKVIEDVIQVLTDSTEKMETRVKEEVDESFIKAEVELDEMHTQVMRQVEKELASFREVVERVKRQLTELKMTYTFEPRNGIEELLLTASRERVLDVLNRIQWVKVILKDNPVQFVPSMFSTIEFNDFCLLVDPIPKVEDRNRFLLLPESQALLFDLDSRQPIRNSALPLQGSEGMSFLTLPSNEVFMCGGNLYGECYLLNCKNWTIPKVANLHTNLRYPGLVYFRGRVYIFGGTKLFPLGPIKEIQFYDRKTSASSLLPLFLHEPRTDFSPCVWQDFIYIAGGEAMGIEMFDPLAETIILLNTDFEGDSPSVLIPFSDQEILILCNTVNSYRPKDGSVEVIFSTKNEFSSPIGLTKYKDSFYFMKDVGKNRYQLMSFSSSYDMEVVLTLSIPSI